MDVKSELDDFEITIARKEGNEYYCYCPFHEERKPSFCTPVNRRVYFCHSCESGGTFERLKKELKSKGIIRHQLQEEDRKIIRMPLSKMTIRDYEELPFAYDDKYLQSRGIFNETVKTWSIKRSPMFIVLPVLNARNGVTGLVLRSIDKDYSPRYQDKYFKKNMRIFGREIPDGGNVVILTEGPFDAIRTWQNVMSSYLRDRVSFVTSIFGSSMSLTQSRLIAKKGTEFLLLMDNERSGYEAVVKVAKNIIGRQISVPDMGTFFSEDPGEMESSELIQIFQKRVPYIRERILGSYSKIAVKK